MFHDADIEKLAPNYREAASDKSQASQMVRGRYSGIQRKITCVIDCARGVVEHDHNGRRRYRQAARSMIYFAGLLADAKRDNEYMQDVLRRGDGWLSSVLRMCKAYARKALFWNRGNFLDTDLPDFYADGLKVLGVSEGATFEEVLSAFKRYIEPQSISNPPIEVASETPVDQEVQPGLETKRKEYNLTREEYAAVKRIVRPSQLRLAAGRLGAYKKRGDIAGFSNTMHQIAEGRPLTVGGNRAGKNVAKQKMGGYASMVITNALVGASCAMEVASRLASFMLTGEI